MFRTIWAALSACIIALSAPSAGAETPDGSSLRLEDVAVVIDGDAYIDWHRPSTAVFEIQDEIIRDIFRAAAKEGAESAMTGARPVILSINITYFDILSDLEKFFCCAKNEVTAEYQLLDASTGAPLAPPEPLGFDHIGRGGFLLLFYPMPEDMQLGRLYQLIADGTRGWIAEES